MTAGRRRGSSTLVTTEEVYQCILDLCTSNPPRPATRDAIALELGVEYARVDEKVDKLVGQNRIRRVLKGIFEPVQVAPDRVVTVSWIPGVAQPVKLEIDDSVLNLSIRDVRTLLFLLGGFARQPADVAEVRRHNNDRTGEL